MSLLRWRENNDAELEAFEDTCTRLGGFAPHIDIEWADGFLTALAANLKLPEPHEWLPALCGDAFDRAFGDPPAAQAAQRALRTRLAVLRDQLGPENLLDDPETRFLNPLLLDPLPGGPGFGATWAQGFMAARQAFAEQWQAPDENAEPEGAQVHAELIAQLQALCDSPARVEAPPEAASGPAPADEAFTPSEAELARVNEAIYAVQDLRLLWVDLAPRVSTRRVDKTPGRNEPCPCGSGRKYKKCHGAG